MSQRLNPIDLRTNITRASNAKWFSRKNFGEILSEDLMIRWYLSNVFDNLLLPVHNIVIKRQYDQTGIFVYFFENKQLRTSALNFKKYSNLKEKTKIYTKIKKDFFFESKIKVKNFKSNIIFKKKKKKKRGKRSNVLSKKFFKRNFKKTSLIANIKEYSQYRQKFLRRFKVKNKKKLFQQLNKKVLDTAALESSLSLIFQKYTLNSKLNIFLYNLEKKNVYLFKYKRFFKKFLKKFLNNILMENIRNIFIFKFSLRSFSSVFFSFIKKKHLFNKKLITILNNSSLNNFKSFPYFFLWNTMLNSNTQKILLKKNTFNIINLFLENPSVQKRLQYFYPKLKLKSFLFLDLNKLKKTRNFLTYFYSFFKKIYKQSSILQYSKNKEKLLIPLSPNIFKKSHTFSENSMLYRLYKNSQIVDVINENKKKSFLVSRNSRYGLIQINQTKSIPSFFEYIKDHKKTFNYLMHFSRLFQLSILYQSASLLGHAVRLVLERNFHEEKGRRHKQIFKFLRRVLRRSLFEHNKVSKKEINFLAKPFYLNKKYKKYFRNSFLYQKLGFLFVLRGKFRRDGKKQKKKLKFNLPMKMQKKTAIVDYYASSFFTRFGTLSFKFWFYSARIESNNQYLAQYQFFNFNKYSFNEKLYLLN